MIEIEELRVPDSLDDADAADFLSMVELRNTIAIATNGPESVTSAAEQLARYRPESSQPASAFIVKLDGGVVGRALRLEPHDATAPEMMCMIEILPAYRNRGIGGALVDATLEWARVRGRTIVQGTSFALPSDGECVSPANGFGAIPLADTSTRFALAHGFALAQVLRASVLELPIDVQPFLAAALEAAGTSYSLVAWHGPTPPQWLDDMADLRTRLSTDIPSGELEMTPDVWDAARIQDYDRGNATAGILHYVAAALDNAGGHLVAYNEVAAPSEGSGMAYQEDTLVAREHRGHRLGMLTKVGNLRILQEELPVATSIFTMNAEENAPMLAINIELGFTPRSYRAFWRRDLPA